MVTPNLVEFLGLYDAYSDFGAMPVDGGALDQAHGFIEAARLMRSLEGRRK